MRRSFTISVLGNLEVHLCPVQANDHREVPRVLFMPGACSLETLEDFKVQCS